jgi:uncharacterized protein with PhoU and TrkA domain
MYQNLQTIKIHSLKAHLDRMQDTAETMASLAAGEVLSGRPEFAAELHSLTTRLLAIKARFDIVSQGARTKEPVE